jgi:glutamate--cysteine ligase
LYSSWQPRLNGLLERGGDTILVGGLKGLEKESLRVLANGQLAQTPHPPALGSAMTHPHLTTDYSEAQLEFITPPLPDTPQLLDFLRELHAFVYRNIGDELLWATSMPCIVGGDASVPIAQYGTSNVGRMKHVYRVGLDHRYGRLMQAISGVHYNYSLPTAIWPLLRAIDNDQRSIADYQSEGYFRLIRNFQRHAWLVPYLFGASPAVCRSFLEGQPHRLENFDRHTLYLPYATSLRMSDIGYKNKAQDGLNISYNDLATYVADLGHAIATPAPEYMALGVQANGEWRQLNGNVLQIENEYYSFIRPKNVARSGEKPSLALRDRGVEYVEIRAPDVNIYTPLGIDEAQLRFLEALLIFCLLEDSPLVNAEEQAEISHNQALVTRRGREPGLRLRRRGQEIPLKDWGLAVLEPVAAIAKLLDNGSGGRAHQEAIELQRQALLDPDRTPSARMLKEMRAQGETFIAFAMRWSLKYAAEFRSLPVPAEALDRLTQLAAQSLNEQTQIEASDAIPFEQYLEQYFAQA